MPLFSMTIGGITLQHLPDGVTPEGGGRPIKERVTIEGRVIATRPSRPGTRRLRVVAPDRKAISAADADALTALAEGGAPFTLALTGYELQGTFHGCVFDGAPRFPEVGHPDFRSYDFTLFIPQQGGP